MAVRPKRVEGDRGKLTESPDGDLAPGTKNSDVAPRVLARLVTSPELSALRIIRATEENSAVSERTSIEPLLEQLVDDVREANRGNLGRAEAMLINQATALQSLFARLVERGMRSEMVSGFEANMRMALRAQAQCRATLETLAAIRFPPVVYAKQANVTTGPQQINNGPPSPSPARDTKTPQNELSGATNGLLPDGQTSQTEGRVDPAVGTLEKVDRPQVP